MAHVKIEVIELQRDHVLKIYTRIVTLRFHRKEIFWLEHILPNNNLLHTVDICTFSTQASRSTSAKAVVVVVVTTLGTKYSRMPLYVARVNCWYSSVCRYAISYGINTM